MPFMITFEVEGGDSCDPNAIVMEAPDGTAVKLDPFGSALKEVRLYNKSEGQVYVAMSVTNVPGNHADKLQASFPDDSAFFMDPGDIKSVIISFKQTAPIPAKYLSPK